MGRPGSGGGDRRISGSGILAGAAGRWKTPPLPLGGPGAAAPAAGETAPFYKPHKTRAKKPLLFRQKYEPNLLC